MKRYLLLMILNMAVLCAWAAPISNGAAYRKAVAFMNARGVTMRETPGMAFSRAGTVTSSKGSLYYVFNVGNDNGFVIVAGDDAVSPILGYTDSGTFDSDKLPESAKVMLEDYARQIVAIQQNPSLSAATVSTREAIAPLMETTWDQSAPYNYLCPIVASETERSVTGCVATAMAQVMFYHKWPIDATQVIPAYSYLNDAGVNVSIEGEKATTFNWDAMQLSYTGTESEDNESAKAVAELMVYAGKSVQMMYSSTASGAYSYSIAPAFKTYFDYDGGMKLVTRDNYSADEWDQLIYDEIASERPVIIGANAVSQLGSGGHEFICDGYDGNGLYHINWGWGGYSDGYFRLSLLNPDGEGIGGTEGSGGYSFDQDAIIGIQPDRGNDDAEAMVLSAYALSASGTTAMRTDKSSDFSVPIYLETYNITGVTATFDVAIGVFDSGMNLVDTKVLEEKATINNMSGFAGGDEIVNFGAELSDGVYYLKLVSRVTGDTEWHLQNSASIYYIVAKIEGNTATFENIAPNSDITIENVTIVGNKRATSVQKISVTLTNSGTANTNELYAFVNGQLLAGIGVNIDPGTSADYSFSWTPSKTGKYTITLASDEDGKNVLSSTDVTIKSSISANLSVSFEVDNATGNTILGNAISGVVTITNKAAAEYYDNVYLYLFYDGKDDFMYSTDYDTHFVQLATGESTQLSFNFTNLDYGKEYLLMVRYNNRGTQTKNQKDCSGWYTLDDSTGIQEIEEVVDTDAPVYDLRGVRMPDGAALPKGIYIKGGKKIVIK